MDDYKAELLRGLQLIRTEVKEHAERYREKMKKYFDANQAVEASRNDWNRKAFQNCGRPEKESRGCVGLMKAQRWAEFDDPRGVVIGATSLEEAKRIKEYHRFLCCSKYARDMLLVFPSGDAEIIAWSPLVDAVGMWVAGGATIYLVAGPRPSADKAWAQVAEQARQQIDTYIRPEYRWKIVDKFPLATATVDWRAPCFALGFVEDAERVLSERQAHVFYAARAQQLETCLQMEPLPNKDHGVGIGLVDHSETKVGHGSGKKESARSVDDGDALRDRDMGSMHRPSGTVF
ncbi:unnamed protein product [Heligmosomoides polygyrus]|uniref:AMP-binding domain-containing protein n=1 Tax=Heligmosomoides polygyrus TaxID=6339 RepID=A0A183FWE3_HELPZ|nr:unnamed protein product [Heligmosomoides polygyrus]